MKADDPRHGTYAGAQAHHWDGEPRCEPCRVAYNAYQREYRNRPTAKRRTGESNRATSRALWRLAETHRAEYAELYAEELAAERGVA